MEGRGKSFATSAGAIMMPPSSPRTRVAWPSRTVFLSKRMVFTDERTAAAFTEKRTAFVSIAGGKTKRKQPD